MRERLIGIDAGGTMTKVVLFDVAGNEIACERQPNVMLLPEQGWTERDADHMWAATCLSIRTLLDRTGTNPADIIAITPSGYGGGVYLIDRDGAPVRNGLVSTDTRSVPLIEYWNETGLREQVSDVIEQQVWPGQTLAILAWMQANEPGTLGRTAHVLSCKDYLRFRLCGDISTDPTDAGCAGILNVSRSEISSDVFKLTSLEGWLSKLPPVGSPTEVAGKINDNVAAQTGLKAGTPVVRGVYDVVGCSLASGVQQASQLAAVAGTFSIHSTLHRKPALSPLPHIQTPYPVAGQILATTATPTSASNLEWFCKTAMRAEADLARAQGRSIYEICNEMVAGTLPRESRIQFFPFLYDGPRGAPAGFAGLTASSTMPDLLRAIYEGVVFAHRTDLTYLLNGPDAAQPDVIRLAGGPSRSRVWSQMFADGLGLPVEIASGTELGAKGGAICGAVATGAYKDVPSAIKNMVKVESRLEPDPDRAGALSDKYALYCSAVETSVAAWKKTKRATTLQPDTPARKASAA
ncbi:MAG: FGGY-family carbohydrate kinase [Aestuariivirga sp.]|uniref:FGGY-family carbohydrate kinase n=1 Tax=Aestuariivirga sp. TaxID=2650926 RepID=UPI0030173DF5